MGLLVFSWFPQNNLIYFFKNIAFFFVNFSKLIFFGLLTVRTYWSTLVDVFYCTKNGKFGIVGSSLRYLYFLSQKKNPLKSLPFSEV